LPLSTSPLKNGPGSFGLLPFPPPPVYRRSLSRGLGHIFEVHRIRTVFSPPFLPVPWAKVVLPFGLRSLISFLPSSPSFPFGDTRCQYPLFPSYFFFFFSFYFFPYTFSPLHFTLLAGCLNRQQNDRLSNLSTRTGPLYLVFSRCSFLRLRHRDVQNSLRSFGPPLWQLPPFHDFRTVFQPKVPPLPPDLSSSLQPIRTSDLFPPPVPKTFPFLLFVLPLSVEFFLGAWAAKWSVGQCCSFRPWSHFFPWRWCSIGCPRTGLVFLWTAFCFFSFMKHQIRDFLCPWPFSSFAVPPPPTHLFFGWEQVLHGFSCFQVFRPTPLKLAPDSLLFFPASFLEKSIFPPMTTSSGITRRNLFVFHLPPRSFFLFFCCGRENGAFDLGMVSWAGPLVNYLTTFPPSNTFGLSQDL